MAASEAALADRGLRTVFKTALCIVPPRPLWPSIQAVRAVHDKSYLRWPPHINVAFPFVEEKRAQEAADLLGATFRAQRLGPFRIHLDRAGFFAHGKRSSTVWLHPSVEGERPGVLDMLQSAVQDAIPACSHLRDGVGGGTFRPHLSLLQLGGEAQAKRAVAAIEEHGLGRCGEALELIARGKARGLRGRDGPEEHAGSGEAGPVGAIAGEGLAWEVRHLVVVARSGFGDPFRVVARVALDGCEDGERPPPPPARPEHRGVAGAASAADDMEGVAEVRDGATAGEVHVGYVYEPPNPADGARCLRAGSNGAAIMAARASGSEDAPEGRERTTEGTTAT